MTQDILLSISGLQLEGEEEPIEIITTGHYIKRDGWHYISYEELEEENKAPIKALLKIQKEQVELIKQGETKVHMIFEKGKEHTTKYYLPYGTLSLGIFTTNLYLEEWEDKLCVKVEYELELNHSHLSSCVVKIKIQKKSHQNLQ